MTGVVVDMHGQCTPRLGGQGLMGCMRDRALEALGWRAGGNYLLTIGRTEVSAAPRVVCAVIGERWFRLASCGLLAAGGAQPACSVRARV